MPTFESYGLKAGHWTGKLIADAAPGRVYLVLYGNIVALAELTANGAREWDVSVKLPPSVLNNGIQCLLMAADDGDADAPLQADAQVLGHLNLMAGGPLDDDLVAEVQLLRAEIDLIKREFRRLASFDGD